MATILEAPEEGEEHALTRLVALATEWAGSGVLDRSDLNALLDEVELPARSYRAAIDALAERGLRVATGTPAVDEPDDDDAATGAAIDGFGLFVRRTAHRILSYEDEQALGRRIDAGRLAQQMLDEGSPTDDGFVVELQNRVRDGHAAEDDLARHNVRLVISIANKLRPQCTSGLEFDDMVQEGWLGLSHAITKWEHGRELKFSTYATWWVRQSMERAIGNQARTIRLPIHFIEELRKVLRAERLLAGRGDDASPAALARETELSVSRVDFVLEWRRDARSLDVRIGDGGTSLGDLLVDGGSGVELEVERHLLADAMHEALDGLSERERQVIELRFGFIDGKVRTLEEIGEVFGVTRERIRQIESKTLIKLRHPQRSAKLRPYIEDD